MKTILYLDDSITSHRLMERFLQGVCEVKPARNASEALAILRAHTVDLLIADYLLPGESGLDFIVHAKKEFALEEIPSLLVSGSMDKILITLAVKHGINDCISKPLQKDVVISIVSKMLLEPYHRKVDSLAVNIICLEWTAAGRYYQYCPELMHLEEAGDYRSVSDQMRTYLEARFCAGADLGMVTNAVTTSHIVEKKLDNPLSA